MNTVLSVGQIVLKILKVIISRPELLHKVPEIHSIVLFQKFQEVVRTLRGGSSWVRSLVLECDVEPFEVTRVNYNNRRSTPFVVFYLLFAREERFP